MNAQRVILPLALGCALLLSACTAAPAPDAPDAITTSDAGTAPDADAGTTTGGQQKGGSDEPAAGTPDEATQKYLDCLIDNGVDAIIDGRGRIAYGAAEKGGSIKTGGDTTSPESAAQTTCQEQVPEYVAPNDDEK